MTIVHPKDLTTAPLRVLYSHFVDANIVDENFSNSAVIRSLKNDNEFMLLGHGNEFGLFSVPDKIGRQNRLIIEAKHVDFLRNKTCVGVWCYANKFAEKYSLKGLFSGMIISEYEEAEFLMIKTSPKEVRDEFIKFVNRLDYCIKKYGLKETPTRMPELDDVRSELTVFNYNNLYYFE